MNGTLSDHPLAELVQEISDARLSGALRLSRERAKAAVYFEGGQVSAALSNLRPLRLVEIVRRSGAADAARLGALVPERVSDEEAGDLLLRAGLLDEAALAKLQERRSKEVLRELLRWTEGHWSFDPRVRLAGRQQAGQLDAAALAVEAARDFPPDFVASRVHSDETLAPVEDAPEKIPPGLRLLPSEVFVLSRLYGQLRLREVVTVSGQSEEETRRAVYVLALAGLLGRPNRKPAFTPETLRSAAAAQRLAAERAADEAAPQQEVARPAAERQRRPEPEPEAHGTVEELFARARGATHYEVLGVGASASPEEIKRAYYSHARRLHPDRFRRDADEELRQRIDAAFAKIAQAYDTLKDAASRSAYDLKLARKRGG